MLKYLGWVAGFLEGEGCFSFRSGASICTSQVQKQPLIQLQNIIGGKIHKAHTPAFKPMFRHYLFGAHAIATMMTIYPLMSFRRQTKLRQIIKLWKKQPGRQRHATICSRHDDGTFC